MPVSLRASPPPAEPPSPAFHPHGRGRAAGRAYVTFGAILFVVAWFLGGIESYFTDNLYNRALVARSAANGTGGLETSYKHWFFDGRPAIRAEDWHRSASLVLYSMAGRHLAVDPHNIVRIVHALLFTLWGLSVMALSQWLARRCTLSGTPPDSAAPGFAGLVIVGAIFLLPWLGRIAMDSYLDDLPAALLALGACALLLPSGLRWWRSGAAGILAGAAFWMKDLYLVWILCAPLTAWILMEPAGRNKSYPWRGRLNCVLLFTAAMIVTAGGKIVWNFAELGIGLPDQARTALNARLIGGLPDAENQFFHHTDGLEAPRAYMATLLANNPGALLVKHALAALTALKDSGITFLLLIAACGTAMMGRHHQRLRRIGLATLVVTAAFTMFFVAGLGEAGQLRYWLLPLSGALALAATVLRQGLAAAGQQLGRPVSRRLVACLWAVMGLACLPQFLSTLAQHYSREPPFTDRFMARTAAYARPDESILVQLHRGTYFWSKYPRLAFTGMSADATEAADCSVLHAVAREAKARVAAVAHPPMIEKLTSCGFVLLQRTDRAALLGPPRTSSGLSRSSE